VNGVHEIDDHALLVGANTVNAVDKEDGRAGRSDLCKQLYEVRDRQAEAGCELCPARARNAVILEEENGAVGCCLLGKALQDGGFAAARETPDGDNSVMVKFSYDLVLKLATLDVEVINLRPIVQYRGLIEKCANTAPKSGAGSRAEKSSLKELAEGVILRTNSLQCHHSLMWISRGPTRAR
jgi:hypothetical protein